MWTQRERLSSETLQMFYSSLSPSGGFVGDLHQYSVSTAQLATFLKFRPSWGFKPRKCLENGQQKHSFQPCVDIAWAFSATEAKRSTVRPSEAIADTMSPCTSGVNQQSLHKHTHVKSQTHTGQHFCKDPPSENPSQLLNFRHDWGKHTCPESIFNFPEGTSQRD